MARVETKAHEVVITEQSLKELVQALEEKKEEYKKGKKDVNRSGFKVSSPYSNVTFRIIPEFGYKQETLRFSLDK